MNESDTAAVYESGMEHKRAGRTEQARAAFEEAIRLDPGLAGAHFELGIIAFRAGQLDQAERSFRQAATLDPGNSYYSLNLGVALQKQGDLEAAEPCYRQSIDAAPDNPAAHFSLGVLLQALDRFPEAEHAYRQCLRLAPNHPKALDNLVTIFLRAGRLDEAEELLRQLLQRAPDDPGLLMRQGMLLIERSDLMAAEAPLRRSIAARENPSAILPLVALLNQTNRHAEAEPLARRAAELTRNDPGVLCHLALSYRIQPADPLPGALKKALSSDALDRGTKTRVLFALAKAHDDLDDFGQAVTYAREANARVIAHHPFRIDTFLERIDWSRRNYTQPRISGPGHADDPRPVFIVGQSRAGKTLVETLLAMHEGVYPAGESKEFHALISRFRDAQIKEHGSNLRGRLLSPAESARFGDEFITLLRRRAPGARCVTCTLPGYYLLVGLIFATLPGARVIHCQRDPLDQCLEMYFRFYLSPSMSFTSDPALLARHYRAYRGLMAHWRAVYGEHMLEMPYETLVRQPRESSARLLAYCGLEGTGGRHRVELNTAGIGRGQRYAEHLPELVQGLVGIV